ncbi:uncharacterized protein LOC108912502 [Anoplophora glabripennis]|uniref:uncharacterized protein LOC108912502 n=1 Tax=Anoplophora glabripennis TaxID=217634 RepID=UPI0008734E91|nr:uncharacterized protein LOC108912502 [Anoplophora glabripennis]
MKILTLFFLASALPCIHPNILDAIPKIAKAIGYDIIDKAGGNTRCSSDLKVLLKDLIRRKLWVIEMLDASGKINSGFLKGNMYVVGNFDQCLSIHVEKNDTVIDGQYCTVILQPSSRYSNDATVLLDTTVASDYLGIELGPHGKEMIKMMKVTFGLCLPASCTIGNLQSLWNHMEHVFRAPVHLSFEDVLCRTKDKPIDPYPMDEYVIVGFGIYGFVLLLSTLYDILIHQHVEVNGMQQEHLLTAFSVYSNLKKLFAFPKSSEEGIGLKCLSGIKVISMLWIIFGHRILLNIFSPNINAMSVFEWSKNIENTPIMATSFSVDTFFVLSGLLLSYVYLKNQHLLKRTGMPVTLLYTYRLLRISPALAATILFYISIFKKLADGPAWSLISQKVTGSCYKFWWTTFFFGTNLVPMQLQCIEQSWYLAVDSQLYFISPIILKNLIKFPKRTVLACLVACLVSAVYTYVITIQNHYGAMYYEGNKEYYHSIYLPTFVRMPAWLIGIVFGYFVVAYQQITIPKCVNVFVWLFSLGTMAFIVLVHLVFARNPYDPFRSAVFNAAARPMWALSVAFIVFLCVSGHGGVIDKFLSLPIFQVLVRLTYSSFLVHLGLLLFLKGRAKTAGYFSNLNSVLDFTGDLFLTFILATVWCLAFETPFLNISKIAMQKGMSNLQAKKAITQYRSLTKKMRKKKNYVVCVYSYKDIKSKKKNSQKNNLNSASDFVRNTLSNHMLTVPQRMKFAVVVLVICSQNVQAITLDSNLTIPEPLLTDITNFLIDNVGNQSITFGDILVSDIMQEALNTYGYADVAAAIISLDETLGLLNQMGQLQYVIDQLAAVDDMCFHQLLLFIGALNRLDIWALKMFDATAKIQSGILEGNMMHLGNFDECLKVDVLANETQINGQYCTAFFSNIGDKPIMAAMAEDPLLMRQSYGFCVPAVCNSSSLDAVFRLVEEALQSPLHVYFVDDLCLSNVKTKPFSTKAVVAIIFFAVVGLVVISSTVYDIYFFKEQNHQGPCLLTAFSFYTNGRKLLSTKASTDSVACLNGIRVISIMWIVLGHRYMYSALLPLINLVDVTEFQTLPASGIISGGNLAVDTFFVLSGLLLVYVYLVHKEKGKTTPLGMFYVHRILRLTPALATLILFYATLLEYMVSAPFWPSLADILQGECERNWWVTLLYVQNFVNSNAMCIRHTWYLAVDTQLYFLSPLLLIPLTKWPKFALSVVGSLIVVCCTLAFIISWEKNFGPAFFNISDEQMKYLYSAPHVRAPAWLVGFLLGYILFKMRSRPLKINKTVQILLWSACLAVIAGILAYHKRIGDLFFDPHRLEAAFINSVPKLVWAIVISIIIFLCATGYGGFINRFLSNPIFTVLNRINYNVYLLHMLVLELSLGQTKTPTYASHFDYVYYFWGDYVFSSLLAVVWTLCFESPIIALERLIFARPKSTKQVQELSGSYNNAVSVVVIENNLENNGKSNISAE